MAFPKKPFTGVYSNQKSDWHQAVPLLSNEFEPVSVYRIRRELMSNKAGVTRIERRFG
jgi:hypothetical protein